MKEELLYRRNRTQKKCIKECIKHFNWWDSSDRLLSFGKYYLITNKILFSHLSFVVRFEHKLFWETFFGWAPELQLILSHFFFSNHSQFWLSYTHSAFMSRKFRNTFYCWYQRSPENHLYGPILVWVDESWRRRSDSTFVWSQSKTLRRLFSQSVLDKAPEDWDRPILSL